VNAYAEGAGLALLLLQGGPGLTSRSVAPASELLRGRFQVIPLERGNETISGLIDQMETVRRELGHEQWFVLGHSWGAAMAVLYAARHPERVAGLVLAHPMEISSAFTEPACGDAPDEDQLTLDFDQHVGDALWDNLHQSWPDASGDGYDLTPVARQITTPALVLAGERDTIDRRSCTLWAELSHAELVCLPECGHWSFLEQPERFREVVLDFLEGHTVEHAMTAA
jgi:proline iminopeptidase